jgi:curved DNA binding protein
VSARCSDLAVHIDGYIASVAHTAVCGGADGAAAPPPSGKGGDVLAAAACAQELLLRVVRPGHKNTEVPLALDAVAKAFGVSGCEGVLTHQLKRFVIDGNKVAMAKSTPELRAAEFEFEANEVYAIDVVFSSGEGKPRCMDEKATNVYKRQLDKRYSVKMKAARALMGEIGKRNPILPFSGRSLGRGEGAVKLGMTECLAHELLHVYPVLHEKPGDCVAHFKATVLLMPNGPDKVTGLPPPAATSDKSLEDETFKPLLTAPLKASKKAAKKAAKKEKGGGAGGAAPMAA